MASASRPASPCVTAPGVSEQELIALCHRKIGKFKSPDRIHFHGRAAERGRPGKIQRRKLQDLFAS
jgi:acyl-coenzyme A synthetase/AMP-(fatty) acid ligase